MCVHKLPEFGIVAFQIRMAGKDMEMVSKKMI